MDGNDDVLPGVEWFWKSSVISPHYVFSTGEKHMNLTDHQNSGDQIPSGKVFLEKSLFLEHIELNHI